MDILLAEWIGLLFTGLGTLFLIGELLVNMRGFFGILGIGFIVFYFSINLDMTALLFMLIIYFIGLLLIIIDGKVINDGTLAVIGLACMLAAVALASSSFFAGLYAILGVLIGSGGAFIFLKIFEPRNMWNKLALKDRLTKEAGYSSMNIAYESLINKKGVTVTDLRPVGTIKIDQQTYSAISNAQWIPKNTTIVVTHVDGTRILVREVKEHHS